MEVHCIDKILEEHNLSVYTEMIQTCMLVYINPTKQKSQKKKKQKKLCKKKRYWSSDGHVSYWKTPNPAS
jgi:ribonuclease PH